MLIFRKLMFRGFLLALSLVASLCLLTACSDGDSTAASTGYNFDGSWYVIPSNLKTTGPCIWNVTPATITIKGQCSSATASTSASLSPPVCNGNSITINGSLNEAINTVRMTVVNATSMTGTGRGSAAAGSCSAEYDLKATLMTR